MHDGIKNSDKQEPACGREEEEKEDKMSYNNQKKIALINDFTGIWALLDRGRAAGDFDAESTVLSASNLNFFQSYRISKFLF